jgi:uncharacterized membrane protein YfcA
MDFVVIAITAFAAAAVTLVSGFGLGSVLLPVFALFMPVPVAVAATAVVHLANNLFKLVLVGRQADRRSVLRFGLPAALAAVAGAALIGAFDQATPLAVYELGGRRCEVTLVKLVIGLLIVGFAVLEFLPGFSRLAFDAKYLPLGGVISGFFGGLSGHQGALRSAFLVKAGLTKGEFIGTGVVAAVMVDATRLAVYGLAAGGANLTELNGARGAMVVTGTVAALAGSLLAARLIEKITLKGVQVTVAIGLGVIGVAMGMGMI